jgi:hypothetical protein
MRTAALFALAFAPAWAQITRPASTTQTAEPSEVSRAGTLPAKVPQAFHLRIAPQTFNELEKRFDGKLATTGGANDPLDLLGGTRGLYLDNCGAIFTTEVSLIVTPTTNPFRQTISKELAAQVHQRKVAHLPLLRQAMQEMMKTAAMTLVQVPDGQQIVVAVRVLYLPWEDTTGLPAQIVMKADRKSAMAGNIQTDEQ